MIEGTQEPNGAILPKITDVGGMTDQRHALSTMGAAFWPRPMKLETVKGLARGSVDRSSPGHRSQLLVPGHESPLIAPILTRAWRVRLMGQLTHLSEKDRV